VILRSHREEVPKGIFETVEVLLVALDYALFDLERGGNGNGPQEIPELMGIVPDRER